MREWTRRSRRHQTDFASASASQQTALLNQIAFERNRSPELNAIDFFILARGMTVDGHASRRVQGAAGGVRLRAERESISIAHLKSQLRKSD